MVKYVHKIDEEVFSEVVNIGEMVMHVEEQRGKAMSLCVKMTWLNLCFSRQYRGGDITCTIFVSYWMGTLLFDFCSTFLYMSVKLALGFDVVFMYFIPLSMFLPQLQS